MWQILRYHIRVPRSFVSSVLEEIDPRRVEKRKHLCFQRRTYRCGRPKFTWHLDEYDKRLV